MTLIHSIKLISQTLYISFMTITYRKIPNISTWLIAILKHILVSLYSERAYIRGAYIRMAFCVSIFISRQYIDHYVSRISKSLANYRSLSKTHFYFALKSILTRIFLISFYLTYINIFTCFRKLYVLSLIFVH